MPAHGVAALRAALQASVQRGDAGEDELRRALALFATEARRRELRPEQLLVLLKEAWRSLPEIRVLRPVVRDPRLEWLVSEAIRTYYAVARRSPAVSPEADRPEAR